MSAEPPLVSVVTAAYRSEPAQLRAALESACGQSYRHIDVVVSDDSPTDELCALVESLRDPRVRYRHNDPPLGVARNHWRCLREAPGELIAILNHDDLLEPSFIERLAAPLIADPTLALAFCDHWIIDAQGRRQLQESEQCSSRYARTTLAAGAHRPFFGLLVRQTIPMAMGALFRRSAVPAVLPDDAGPAYDLWLTYLLCGTGLGAYYVPARLSSWRAHAGNLTSAGDISLLEGAARCWSAVVADPAALPAHPAARLKEASAHAACARWYGRQGLARRARTAALRSWRARASWRAAAYFMLGMLPASLGRQLASARR